jgi:peptidoglycan/LPS O-acetylase OafA/YrhL
VDENDPVYLGLWSLLLYVGAVVLFATIFFLGFERPILASRPRYQPSAANGIMPVSNSESARLQS